MVSVIEATMGSARGGSSRRGRPKKSSDNDSNDFLTLTLVEAGSMVEMYCDGTNWFVTGHVASETAPSFGDASGL